MVRSLGGLAGIMLGASASASASVVINPVPAPIAAGISVGINWLATAPAIAPINGRAARIQQMKPISDGSGRAFINDTSGMIEVMRPGAGNPTPWFNVAAAVPSLTNATDATQQGLMSFALHPNFNGDPGKPGYGVFYTLETETAGSSKPNMTANGPIDHLNVVREFTVADPNAATATITSSREVLSATQPYRDHGPGMISFNTSAKVGDKDYGNLYIGIGDGGNWADVNNNAQDPMSPAGKILRINPADPDGVGSASYSIPADNPFVGQGGKAPEVWASGLRNPQQFSWDLATGKMIVIDIGFSSLEEVNIGKAGANYGWPIREGTLARADRWGEGVYDDPPNDGSFVDPIAQYDHEEIFRSGEFNLAAISGAFVYHGSIAELQDMVVLSDLVSGRVFYFPFAEEPQGDLVDMKELLFTIDGQPARFADFEKIGGRTDLRLGESGNGELTFMFKTTGDIYALTPVPEPASWTLMIAGFGMIGGALRRQRLTAGVA